jgi:hypothetical protein
VPSSDPLAVLLSLGFLVVLYLFLAWVVRSSVRDLRRSDEELVPRGQVAGADGEPPAGSDGRDVRPGVAPRLEVVAAMGHDPGSAIDVGDGAMLGRSNGADIHVDDPFASSAHARIFQRGQAMFIEDMGSTNGTFLNGRQIRRPEQLNVADTVRIGDTEFRYQE